VDSLDAVKQEKHLFALAKFFQSPWIMLRPRRPHGGTQESQNMSHTDWAVHGFEIDNANKKILELSWFHLEHPLDMSDFVGPHRSKIWKKRRADPIVKDQARNSVDRKSDNTDSI